MQTTFLFIITPITAAKVRKKKQSTKLFGKNLIFPSLDAGYGCEVAERMKSSITQS